MLGMISLQRQAAEEAEVLGHELVGWTEDGVQAEALCRWCKGRLHFEWRPPPTEPIIEGEVVDGPCPKA